MKLYAHQKEIIEKDPVRAGLFLGTGTGKTRTALCLARGKVLVVAPKTQAEDKNWEREWESLIKEGATLRIKKLVIVSKEKFRDHWEELPTDFETVIVDEAHTCLGVTPQTRQRNRMPIPKASQLFEALAMFLARVKPKRLYLCTATIMRNPMTVWAADYLLNPIPDTEIMGSFTAFRQQYYTKLPMSGYQEIWAPKRTNAAKDALAEFVRGLGYVGRLEDFFDVPEQTFRTTYVELTAKQKARIKELRLEYPDPIVLLGKKHQVENGCLAGDEYSPAELFSNPKLDTLLELALEFPRMVVFAKYRAQIEYIAAELRHVGHFVLVLTGDTKERGALLKQANSAKECVFIAQAQISAGWELPEYPLMVFASRTYSFVDYAQALGRIQRANNIKKNLYINLVVRGGVDEAVDKSLASKQDFDERIYAGV